MTLQADFDKISTLREPTWNNNIHYDKMLLECLGLRKNVLDVGCGTGRFSSKLKGQCDHVLGIDLSTAMINKALKTHARLQNLEFVQGDYLYTEFEPESFDAIISIATVHHMDFRRFLETAKHDLKPGGQLIILDLYQRTTPWELMLSMIALPVSRLLQLWYNGRFRPIVKAVHIGRCMPNLMYSCPSQRLQLRPPRSYPGPISKGCCSGDTWLHGRNLPDT